MIKRPIVLGVICVVAAYSVVLTVNAVVNEQGCGVPHDKEKYQRGRAMTNVFVPTGPEYDVYACLLAKANESWQSTCPGNNIPVLQVVRGTRPEGNSEDIAVTKAEGLELAAARWLHDENIIRFDPANEIPDSWNCNDGYLQNVAIHEVGHAFGLDEDCCTSQAGQPPHRSIMSTPLKKDTFPPYGIQPYHCEAIEEANRCDDNDQSCCLYCLPPVRDKCEIAPELCGVQPSPAGGGFCNYSLTYQYNSGVTYEYGFGTIVNSTVELVSSYLSCYSTAQAPPTSTHVNSRSIQANAITPGPTVYVRSRFPDGASGTAEIRGVARDDLWGIQRLEFWLDNEPVILQNFQMRQYDPYTCNEMPATGCNPYSAFQGQLDTSGLTPGTHTLHILALSDHPERIPVYHEWSFEVAAPCESNPPTVSIAQPLTAQTVSGSVLVVANASDDTALERVKIFVDGAVIRNDTTYPYTVNWNTLTVGDGWRDITAEAYDVCGNRKTSLLTRVRVDNGANLVQVAPSADAWVSQTWPTTNYGSTNYLRIRTIDGGIARHTYLKFQVTGVQGTVTSAKLRIRTQDRTLFDPVTVYRIADTSWQESTINYNNASLAVLWSTPVPVPLAADSWHEIDITSAITGDGVYTLALATTADQGNLDFWSRESAYPPVLEITFQP